MMNDGHMYAISHAHASSDYSAQEKLTVQHIMIDSADDISQDVKLILLVHKSKDVIVLL